MSEQRVTARLRATVVRHEIVVVEVFDMDYREAWRRREELCAPHVPDGCDVAFYSAESVESPATLLESATDGGEHA